MGDVLVRLAGPQDRPVIENLIQLYLYDMADVFAFPVGPDGRFAYDFLDRFWQRPYLISWRGELAGFVLVIDGSPITGAQDRQFVAEFFLLRTYRGKGVGRAAFRDVLAANPGAFVRVDTNVSTGLAGWLTERGLKHVGGGIVMQRIGGKQPPRTSGPHRIYALANQALG